MVFGFDIKTLGLQDSFKKGSDNRTTEREQIFDKICSDLLSKYPAIIKVRANQVSSAPKLSGIFTFCREHENELRNQQNDKHSHHTYFVPERIELSPDELIKETYLPKVTTNFFLLEPTGKFQGELFITSDQYSQLKEANFLKLEALTLTTNQSPESSLLAELSEPLSVKYDDIIEVIPATEKSVEHLIAERLLELALNTATKNPSKESLQQVNQTELSNELTSREKTLAAMLYEIFKPNHTSEEAFLAEVSVECLFIGRLLTKQELSNLANQHFEDNHGQAFHVRDPEGEKDPNQELGESNRASDLTIRFRRVSLKRLMSAIAGSYSHN